MPTFTLNGEPLPFGPFTIGEDDEAVQYPANCLLLWSEDVLAAKGLTRIPDPEISLADQVSMKLADAQAEYDARRQTPAPYDFGDTEALDDLGTNVGEAGAQTLQMRTDGATDDVRNWLCAAHAALVAIVAGSPLAIIPIKTTANVWVQAPALQAQQALVTGDGTQIGALARGMALLARFGELKAEINAAEDAEALAAIDVSGGWPP